MIDPSTRHAFEAAVTSGADAFGDVEAAAKGAKANDLAAADRLAVALARVGFATPEAITLVYDQFARGWLGTDLGTSAAEPLMTQLAELPASFWAAFWSVVEDAAVGISAGEITSRVAALLGLVAPDYVARAEMTARQHPGSAGAADRDLPPRLGLEMLAVQPAGSLGQDFHRLIVDNKFDLEVLDREAIGLSRLPPALAYLNTRILQMHDVWHLVGGYRTTALGEVAISAFQLAQFGHSYSAQFLAVTVATARFGLPMALPVLLQVIAEGWRHGRTGPSFMAIPWEAEWHQPIDAIRAKFGIAPYQSVIPADLVEQMRGMAA